MVVKPYVRVLFLGAIAVFVSNKLFVRPWILEAGLPAGFRVLVNSLPNLSEAIIGTLLLTGIGLEVRERSSGRLGELPDTAVYLLAILVWISFSTRWARRSTTLWPTTDYSVWPHSIR